MNEWMNELTSNMNDEQDEFLWDLKHFLRFFTLKQQADRQTDGLALSNLTVAEYDNEWIDE